MFKFKKFMVLALSVLLVFATIVGCSKNAAPSSEGNNQNQEENKSETNKEEQKNDSKNAQITFWTLSLSPTRIISASGYFCS